MTLSRKEIESILSGVDRLASEFKSGDIFNKMKDGPQSKKAHTKESFRVIMDTKSQSEYMAQMLGMMMLTGEMGCLLHQWADLYELTSEEYNAKFKIEEGQDPAQLLIAQSRQSTSVDAPRVSNLFTLYESVAVFARRGILKVKRGDQISFEFNLSPEDLKLLDKKLEEIHELRKSLSHYNGFISKKVEVSE